MYLEYAFIAVFMAYQLCFRAGIKPKISHAGALLSVSLYPAYLDNTIAAVLGKGRDLLPVSAFALSEFSLYFIREAAIFLVQFIHSRQHPK